MRFGATLVVCVGLSLTAAGCDQTDRAFFKQGIGTELNSGDIAASTTAQNEYAKYVCQQAGLAYDADSGSCGSNRPTDWQLFVQAGMNDIDQRCDAYLLWIDYVRRGRDPTLRVISDAATYSALIMDRAGVSAAPIAIAGAAIGFARNTFENVTSRLILEVNHSAVQSVVLSAQRQYREELFGTGDVKRAPVVIASKPAAVYALRSYLRLCMPVTIEAEINNTVATFARGGPQALRDQDPLITASTAGVLTLDVGKPIKPTDPAPTGYISNPMGDIERSINLSRGKSIQRALCVSGQNGDFGGPKSETRLALRAFKAGLLGAAVVDSEIGQLKSVAERNKAYDAVAKFPSCRRAQLATPYEVGTLTRFGVADFRQNQLKVALVQAKQQGAKDEAGKEISDDFINKIGQVPARGPIVMDADVRTAIGILRKHYQAPPGNTIDFQFIDTLVHRTAL